MWFELPDAEEDVDDDHDSDYDLDDDNDESDDDATNLTASSKSSAHSSGDDDDNDDNKSIPELTTGVDNEGKDSDGEDSNHDSNDSSDDSDDESNDKNDNPKVKQVDNNDKADDTDEDGHDGDVLYLCKRASPELQTVISFLTTRVTQSDEDHWKKVRRCVQYLHGSKDLYLTLEIDDGITIKWWIDASFAVHPDMRSHTEGTMSLGKGSV